MDQHQPGKAGPTTMEDKDYNLLRPFDPKTAKAGGMFCSIRGNFERELIAGPDHSGRVCVAIEGDYNLVWPSDLRLAPLCWIEGRPVYKGDVLYVKFPEPRTGSVVTAEFPQDDDTISTFRSENGAVPKIRHDQLTCTPPKVKREGWGVARVGLTKKTREEAEEILRQHKELRGDEPLDDFFKGDLRVVRIEWEEPAGQEGGAA